MRSIRPAGSAAAAASKPSRSEWSSGSSPEFTSMPSSMSLQKPPSYRLPPTSVKWRRRNGFPQPSVITKSPRSRPFTMAVACEAPGTGIPAAANSSRAMISLA